VGAEQRTAMRSERGSDRDASMQTKPGRRQGIMPGLTILND